MGDQLTFDEYRKARSVGGLGVLTRKDLADFSKAELRIYYLMHDGKWHKASEIIEVSGQREGLRRLRALRDYVNIERKLWRGREWTYRMTYK